MQYHSVKITSLYVNKNTFILDVPRRSNKMVFQRIPKKMRRRVMSTTVKRMPKDLQALHKKSVIITCYS